MTATKRILILEDDPIQAQTYIEAFEGSGWTITWITTLAGVPAGIAKADVILADRGLPDGDGLSIAAMLKDRDIEIPVIMLTAANTQEERLDGLIQGVADYVGKGVDVREVVIRCEAQLRNIQRTRGDRDGILIIGSAEAPADDRLVISTGDRIAARQSTFDALKTKQDRQRHILEPTAFAILKRLASTPGEVVTIAEIEQSFFHRTEHTRASVRNAISKIRGCIDRNEQKDFLPTTFLHTYLPEDKDDEPGYYLRKIPIGPDEPASPPARPVKAQRHAS